MTSSFAQQMKEIVRKGRKARKVNPKSRPSLREHTSWAKESGERQDFFFGVLLIQSCQELARQSQIDHPESTSTLDSSLFFAGLHGAALSFSSGKHMPVCWKSEAASHGLPLASCQTWISNLKRVNDKKESLKVFLLVQHQQHGGKPLPVDVYGSGEDMQAIKKQAKEDGLAITFNSGIDHLDEAIHTYR